jgi:hypothetical protein
MKNTMLIYYHISNRMSDNTRVIHSFIDHIRLNRLWISLEFAEGFG